ncbi:MAG: DUF1329 domain-containing protein [Gammaproteobacteria bacterium]|nr:DUF1329 domain-containing protein [Gammaproteobacteria bacterium]
MKRRIFVQLAALAAWARSRPLLAAAGAGQAAQLGSTLTPLGAEKAGNQAGTIPAWNGGLPQGAMKRGADPFAADRPLYVITPGNADQYAGVLTEGHKALLATFPDYKMPVYPSRRSASYPDWYYQATIDNATQVSLTDHGYGFTGTARGAPFPLPASATEAMWNHIMRYNTAGWRGYLNSAVTQRDGGYTLGRAYLQLTYIYNNRNYSAAQLDNQNLYAMIKTVAPPDKAGTADLLRVPIDRVKEDTKIWEFNTALQRVRRIGNVGYDNPLFDGLMTQDQVDMFNGPLDRYTVKLLGKREMLVPYNAYRLYSPRIKYRDIVHPGHLNQDLTRYELHRVWVIQADLRPGFSHIYRKRYFYLDEDSWLILLEDIYDDRLQFWRTAEAHAINYGDVPVVIAGVQVHYDLQSRRYVILNMTNEEKDFVEYDWQRPPSYFTPQQLQRFATAGVV